MCLWVSPFKPALCRLCPYLNPLNVSVICRSQNGIVRLLFLEFSTAFSAIQPHLMINNMTKADVNSTIILWICSFLTHRPQRVRISNSTTEVKSEWTLVYHKVAWYNQRCLHSTPRTADIVIKEFCRRRPQMTRPCLAWLPKKEATGPQCRIW